MFFWSIVLRPGMKKQRLVSVISGNEFTRAAKAESETDPETRAGFENLARAYLRLAEQALRNAQTDVIYEPAPPKLDDPELKR
jgi:hypothetical protein